MGNNKTEATITKLLNLFPEWIKARRKRATLSGYDDSHQADVSTSEDRDFLDGFVDYTRMKPEHRNLI